MEKQWSIGDLKILTILRIRGSRGGENGLPVSMLLTIVALFQEKELRAVAALSPTPIVRHFIVSTWPRCVISRRNQAADTRRVTWAP